MQKRKIVITGAIGVFIFALMGVAGYKVVPSVFVGKNNNASASSSPDINNDGIVNALDLSIVLSNWNTTSATADLNNDGIVNALDLSILLSNWGAITASNPPQYGAQLPITYSLASLTGTARYVSPSGNDTTGTGTIASPYATIGRAYSAASANDPIVVRGGTYRQGNVAISSASKPVRVIAYPGETPVFNGAQVYSGGWTTEGSLQYRAYTPQPVTDAMGITFSTCQNQTLDANSACMGQYPDQAWVGATQLKQAGTKVEVADGKFWVDRTNNRIYLTATNVSQGTVEVSSLDKFMSISAPGTRVEGLQITRFSNSANDYGVITVQSSGDGTVLKNIEITDYAFIGIFFAGDTSNQHDNSRLENSTVRFGNWMGVSATYTNNFVIQ
jgi:trimeric autotransporter adhesin